MDIDVALTAVDDNDSSCKLHTLSEAGAGECSDGLPEQQSNELLKRHRVRPRNVWPCSPSKGTLIPLDAHLVDRCYPEMSGSRWGRSSCPGPSSAPSW